MIDATRLENFTGTLPTLPLAILGTSQIGSFGQLRIYESPSEAASVLGGRTVARIRPGSLDSTLTFPPTFYPDDETLTQTPPWVYHCPPDQTYSVRFPYLSGLSGTGFPIQARFDPLGYDSSVYPAFGGLFLESEAYFLPSEKNLVAGGNPQGGLLLPLAAALGEGAPVFGVRVGTSWLPLDAPTLVLPCGVILETQAQGNNDAFDRAVTPYVRITSTSLIVDPGLLGLPFVRRTYTLANYPTWQTLVSTLQSDGIRGFIPFLPKSDGPVLAITSPSSPITLFPSYSTPGAVAPDLTTAAAWAGVLDSEALEIDEIPLVCLSGLTGKALAQDPSSARRILQSLSAQVVIVPWDLMPQCFPYDPTSDLTLARSLQPYISDLDNLLIIWGWGFTEALPRTQNQIPLMPVAYAVAAAMSRDSTSGNPLAPKVNSLLAKEYFQIDWSPGTNQLASPNSVQLNLLHAAGLMPLSRGVSGWGLYGQLQTFDKSQVAHTFTLLALGRAITLGLDSFLGKPDSSLERTKLATALDSIIERFTSSPLGNFTSYLTADLLDITSPGVVSISCVLQFYGEVRSISLQLSLQRRN